MFASRRIVGRFAAPLGRGRRHASQRPAPLRRKRGLRFEELETRVLLSVNPTTLASFLTPNGAYPPSNLVRDGAGDLFGTMSNGGALNDGIVYEIASGSGTITTLASFNGTNGAEPVAGLVEDTSGNFFGTAAYGGASGDGTVFELAHGSGTITTLASFNGANGASPSGSLVEDASGNLFGTASGGGASGDGTVFELVHGSGTITALASFNGTNGSVPKAGVVEDASGNLFGTEPNGGASADGSVFEVAHGSGTITTLASFNGANGAGPDGGVIEDASGNLFGTTYSGGASGDGTVFEIAHASGTITTLASFNNTNGPNPSAGLVEDAGGNLFGTASGATYGDGTVFEIVHASGTITTLASFNGTNGAGPGGLLEDASGNLYGPAGGGGASNLGTVFEIAAGSGTITTLVSFTAPNGVFPEAGLVEDASGDLFGTASAGGLSGGYGTVFEIAHASGTITTLASFNGANGSWPDAGLVEDASGNLFGTTPWGGASDDGTVFEIAHGSGTITTLASFNGTNGAQPDGGLVEDASGDLFGTSSVGGASDDGTVFEVAKGSGTITTLASFNGTNGANPEAGLVEDASGNLFGTTPWGGASDDGTVFEVAHGSGTITTLASFNGTNGADPQAGLVEDASGNLFGTAYDAGVWGYGTVFEVAHGSGTITALASFNYSNGTNPTAGLVEDASGNLFGTTNDGGASGGGTVFELAHGSGTITALASFNDTTGMSPDAGLVEDASGNLFGTMSRGGAGDWGTVFEISRAPTITWPNPANVTYGAALSATQLDATASVPGNFTYSPAAGTVLSAGNQTLTVTFTPTDTTDYSTATDNVSLDVQQAPLTITANSASKTYGQTLAYGSGSTAFTSAGLENGDTLGSLTIAASGGTAGNAPVGNYTLTPSAATGGTFNANNYNITYANGSLTVAPANLTIAANSAVKTYGQTLPYGSGYTTSYYTASGLQNGETIGMVGIQANGADAANAPVGNYTLMIGGARSGTFNASNYNITYANGSLAVKPANLTIAAVGYDKTYGQALPNYIYYGLSSYFTATGLEAGDSIAFVYNTPSGGVAANAPVGNYPVTPSNPQSGTSNGFFASNYNITYANGTLCVTPASLTVSAANATRVYGAPDPAFTATYTGFVNGDTAASALTGSPALGSNDAAASPVGNYAITVAAGNLAAANYAFNFANATLSITPASTAAAVSASPLAVNYGQLVTITATVSAVSPSAATPTGGNVTFYDNGNTVGSRTLSGGTANLATTTLPVGNDVLTAVYAGDGLDFQASPASGGVTVSVTAANSTTSLNLSPATATYGGTLTLSGTLLAGNAPLANETITFSLHGNSVGSAGTNANGVATLGNISLAGYAAGNYASYIGETFAGNGNYAAASATGNLVVNKAALTVTANNASKTYGQTLTLGNAAFTSSGLVSGDSIGNITLTSAGAANTAGVSGSPYAIAPGNAIGTGLTNYNISYANGSLTVNKAPLTVTAANAARVFAAPDPTFTAAFSGFVNGDTPANAVTGSPSFTSTDTASSPVGNYTVSASAGNLAAANYTFTFANATLSVTPASTATALSVSPPSATYGQPVTLTAAVTGVSPSTAYPSGGNVTFYDNGTPLGSATVSDGLATLGTTALAAGAHVLTASYGGDGLDFSASAFTGGTVSTVSGGTIGDNGLASNAYLNSPIGVAVDAVGDIFIADTNNGRVREVNAATGIITTVAGGGTTGYLGDGGQATAATLRSPQAVATDGKGNLYIAEGDGCRIREVNLSTGIITTVAGTGSYGFSGDGGPATAARIGIPESLAVDAAGNIDIADTYNCCVRQVNAVTGIITTVAGTGTAGYNGDGIAGTAAELSFPNAVALDSAGNLYIADTGNYRVREVNLATGVITTVAGTGDWGTSGDGGPATAAQLEGPSGLVVDTSGDLFISDADRIRKVNTAGVITTFAGTGTAGYKGDGGPATAAQLGAPRNLAVDSAGDVFIADSVGNGIRRVSASGLISSVVGNTIGDGLQAIAAILNDPYNLAEDTAGDLFIADCDDQRVREINHLTGVITTVAGNGLAGYNGDGQAATAAELDDPSAVAVDSAGNLYIADSENNRIRKVNLATGIIITVAGNGTHSFNGDGGLATASTLFLPEGVAVDVAGDIFISDAGNSRIREVLAATGRITTVAGTGQYGYNGDGLQGTAAEVDAPAGLAMGSAGILYIADTQNSRVRRLNLASGIITTAAGTGVCGFSGDNQAATAAAIGYPTSVAVDASGNLFISDSIDNCVRKVNISNGVITTFAGDGGSGYSGDGGLPTAASFSGPQGVAVDAVGDVFIADSRDNCLREIVANAVTVQVCVAGTTLNVPSPVTATYGGTLTLSATLLAGTSPAANQTVTFGLGGNSVGTATTNASGVATLGNVSLGGLGVGTHTSCLTASFAGSADYNSSTSAANLTVTPAPLTVTCDSGRVYGAANPTLVANYSGFVNGDTAASALTGSPTLTTTASASSIPGAYPITVGLGSLAADNYSLNPVNGNLTVVPASTSTAVNESSAAISYGQPLTLTATVTAGGLCTATPSGGNVSFYANGTLLGSSPLNSGTATLTTTSLGGGDDAITAAYSGDGLDFSGSLAAGSGLMMVDAAGGDGLNDNGPASLAFLASPQGVAVDASGNIVIADWSHNRVREINHISGIITTIAGTGTAGYSGDGGPATAAEIAGPVAVATDAAGNVYVCDYDNQRVREINMATGTITTVAGTGTAGFNGDGEPATAANLDYPFGVAVDAAGDIYIADYGNNRVREVNATSGLITTVAGTGTGGYNGDNQAGTTAELDYPSDVALDACGSLYIADSGNYRVRRLNAAGVITTVAGTGTCADSGDGGPASAAQLSIQGGLAVDSSGDLFISTAWYAWGFAYGGRVREVNAAGVINTVAGSGNSLGDGGPATAALIQGAEGVAVDAAGNLYIVDRSANRLRCVNAAGIISTVAGISAQDDGLPATATVLNNPQGVAVDAAGDVFLAENDMVYEVNHLTGAIATVAGNGTLGFSGDGGPATAAELYDPTALATDSSGNLYIADGVNCRIREVNALTGVITTVAGGGSGYGGPATAAGLENPSGLAIDAAGDIFISEDGTVSDVREVVAATGLIIPVAGNTQAPTGCDVSDIEPATAATAVTIGYAQGVALDSAGNLYIADSVGHCIDEVNLFSGMLTTVAGTGTYGYSGDGGPATLAKIGYPMGLAVDAAGDIFFSDSAYDCVREVSASTGVITTVAGNGAAGYSGDGGTPTAAQMSNPGAIAINAAGDLYIVDTGNNRVREIVAVPVTVHVAAAGTSLSGRPSATVTYGGTLTLSATLLAGAAPVPGETISFSLHGTTVGTAVTNASGVAMLSGVSAAGYSAGTYNSYLGASFAGDGNYAASSAAANLTVYASIAGRDLFYANSCYNGDSDTACSADDNAIDTSKSALLPGQTATYANYTDSGQGINGIMVDVGGLANPAGLTAADFQFLVGNDSTPSDWTAPTAAPTVAVRAGAGTGGSDRVELIWPDGTIHNQWLQVTVLADANTGLAAPDVFYFGSEPGAVAGQGYASFDDIFAVYRAIGNTPNVAAVTAADVNHDGMVTFDDIFAVYRAIGGAQLNMITAPTTPAAAPTVTAVTDAAVSPAAAPAVEAAPVAAVVTAASVASPAITPAASAATAPAADPAASATVATAVPTSVATTAPTVSATDAAAPAAAPSPPVVVPPNLSDLPATTVAILPTVLSAAQPASTPARPPVAPNPPLHVSAALSPTEAPTALPAVAPAVPAAVYSRPAVALWTDRREPNFWAWDAALAQTDSWNSDLDALI